MTTPAATATRIDQGLGTREAIRYTASPSKTPTGSEALPVAISSPVATATTATSGSGHRRSATSGPEATTARPSRPPCAWGYGPAASATMTSAVHPANTMAASHGRSLTAASPCPAGTGPARDSLVTAPTVTGGSTRTHQSPG